MERTSPAHITDHHQTTMARLEHRRELPTPKKKPNESLLMQTRQPRMVFFVVVAPWLLSQSSKALRDRQSCHHGGSPQVDISDF